MGQGVRPLENEVVHAQFVDTANDSWRTSSFGHQVFSAILPEFRAYTCPQRIQATSRRVCAGMTMSGTQIKLWLSAGTWNVLVR